MRYKTVLQNSAMVKRDTLFIEYLEGIIIEYKAYYHDCISTIHTFKGANNEKALEEYETEKNILSREIKQLECVLEKFYTITDNTNKETK